MARRAPVLSVSPTKDGVWQVNERGPSWIDDGTVRLSRDYDNPDPSELETP